MTFESIESSRDLGQPINLFLFEYGTAATARIGITNGEQPVTFNGVRFTPEPMDRDTLKSSGTLDLSTLAVNTRRDSDVAELFRIYPPGQPVRLTIYQGHADDPDQQFLVCWTGRVLSVKWEDSQAVLNCEPVATSLRRPGLRRRFSPVCPHVLYGPICRADKAASTIGTTMRAAANGVRSVQIMYVADDAMVTRLRNGTFEWTSKAGNLEARMILSVVSDSGVTTLTLGGLVRDLVAGDAVNLVMGCNHQMTDCGDLHANLPNYGGMPWIPTKNPYGKYSPYQ